MAKQTRDKETDQLPEYIYCKMFVLTNNKTASYIFANKGKVTTNPNSLKTLAAKYHNTNEIQKILPVVENQMEQQMRNYLTNKGYVLFSPQDRLNGKMQKYLQNYTDSPNQYETGITETIQLNNIKKVFDPTTGGRYDINQIVGNGAVGIENELQNIDLTNNSTILDKEGVRAILQSMLQQAVGDDLRLKILDKIITLDNLKKEQTDSEDSTVHIYLPHKECPNCPQLKVYIDK